MLGWPPYSKLGVFGKEQNVPFTPAVRQEALVRSKRHCCVCQEFAGRSINVHHITPESEGGSNEIENAIVLCLRCHAEAGHYNPNHPIGNKYHPDELRRHRDAWWQWCMSNPAAMPPKSPIVVAPALIDITPGEWTRKTVVTIHNRWNTPLFQIWVKAAIIGPSSLDEAIDYSPSITLDAVSLCCAELTVAGEILGIKGTDATGCKASLFRLYGLDPGRSAKLIVTDSNRTGSGTEPGQIHFSVIDFSEAPPPLLEQADKRKTAMPFSAPEDGFRIEAVGFKVVKVGSDT
jgi:hypothetical protein